ncbi:Hypothetical predicted protein [Cloeon dipterum]|uniref:Uncharacterized protein n=1 Tax=Cloeon dipterum TaxID=197152 RepID=A0A8S1BMU0_9INSE|nr:Hypothetical predicted protein [Cloeon dipterum]
MIFIAALNPRRPAGAAAATLSAGSLLISSTQTQLIYQKGLQRSKNPMSEKERIQIYQRVGTNKLKEWADDTNINFMDELAEDSDLSDAFRVIKEAFYPKLQFILKPTKATDELELALSTNHMPAEEHIIFFLNLTNLRSYEKNELEELLN